VFWLNFEPLTPNKKPTTFATLTPSTLQTLPVKPKSAKAKFKPTKTISATFRNPRKVGGLKFAVLPDPRIRFLSWMSASVFSFSQMRPNASAAHQT